MSSPNEAARATDRAPIFELDAAVPLLHASIAFKAGSLLDPPGKEGATRLLFRLMRRSAGGRTAEQADETIDRLGGHVGAEVSRSTAGFHGGAIARSTAGFLDFLYDTVVRPGLSASELAQLKQESQAELVERLDDDRGRARHFWLRQLFAGHPYGRSSAGTPSSLAQIELADLEAVRQQLFTRSHLRLAFAGRVERGPVAELAERLAAALPAGSAAPIDPEHPTGPRGRQLVFVDKPERTQTQIVIGGLGTHPSDEDHTALHVANTIFGGTFTSRLMQEVRAKRGWSYGTSSSVPFDRRRQAFSMWTFPQASDAAACLGLELELLSAWVERGVTARELAAAKKYLSKSHAFAIDTAQKRAGLELDEQLYELPSGYQRGYLERVASVTLEQANAAVARRISPENLVIAVLGTHKEIGSAIEAAIPGLASHDVVRFDAD